MKKSLIILAIIISIELMAIFIISVMSNKGDESKNDKQILVEYRNGISFSYPEGWDATIYKENDTEPAADLSYVDELISFNASLIFSPAEKEEVADVGLEDREYSLSSVSETKDTASGIEYFSDNKADTENLGYVIGRMFDYKEGSLKIECNVSGTGYESYKSTCDDIVKSLIVNK